MAHWSGIGIPKTNAIALEVSYTHTPSMVVLPSLAISDDPSSCYLTTFGIVKKSK